MRSALCAFALLACACTESRVASDPSTRRDASPLLRASTGDGGFVAWTDPGGVDALLAGADMPHGDKDPRSCNFAVPQQSCVPGPDGVDWSCRSDCASECDKCSTECRAKLATCRATGDERACGETAGRCTQECLAARDRCASGCPEHVAAYLKDIRENYGCKEKRPALEICKRAVACIAGCDKGKTPDDAREACHAACKKSRAAGCNEGFLQNVDVGNCAAYESPI